MKRLRMLFWLRRFLVGGCLLASVLALWRLSDVQTALWEDRLAAAAYARAQQLQAAGRPADAVAALQTALEYAAPNPDLYEEVALAQFRLGRIDEAVATYRQILAVYPHRYLGSLYRGVGLIELRADRVSAAREDLQRAVDLDPTDWLAFHLLGHARKRLGDLRGARAAWERVLDINPGFQPARDQLRTVTESP